MFNFSVFIILSFFICSSFTFVLYSTYNSTDCTGTPTTQTGFGTGCGINPDNTSYSYSCINNQPFVSSFNNTNCGGSTTPFPTYQQCTGSSPPTAIATCQSSFPSDSVILQRYNNPSCSGDYFLAQFYHINQCFSGFYFTCSSSGQPMMSDCNQKNSQALPLTCVSPGDGNSAIYISPCKGTSGTGSSSTGFISMSPHKTFSLGIALITSLLVVL